MLDLSESTSIKSYRQKTGIPLYYERNEMVVYRIIPHADVANNNKRLWRTIYKMYEMYERSSSRLVRDGFKFTYREKDVFWFDVIFRLKDGKKAIEFYVATSEYQAAKLKRKIENKINATIKEASIDDLYVPDKNTIIQELHYLKHDIFSIHTNTSDVKTPIANILHTVDELLTDGDMARFSVSAEAENRSKWIKSAQWAYEKAASGKVPQRATINGRRLLGAVKVGISALINEVHDFITDVLEALNSSFIKASKSYEKAPVIKKVFSIEDEIGTSRLDRSKGNLPVFRTHIRTAAHAEDRLTRDSLSESLALSLQDLAESNELHATKVVGKKHNRIINELNTLHLTAQTRYDANVNLVSTDEMAKLALMLPNRELQVKYADALDVKKRAEVTIPTVLRNSNGIKLGQAELKDQKIDVYMPLDNPDSFYRGYTFIGSQGSGKDTAIINWVVECNMKHGISFIIPDAIVEEGRGMADKIRDALPPDRIIDLNLNDDDYIPPMDLTEVVTALGRNGASRFADEMIDFMQISGLNRSEKYLTDAAKASGGNLLTIKKIIEDENIRADTIDRLMKAGNLRLAKDLLAWGDNDKVANKCDPILYRLNRFFGNERLYDIFAQDPLPDVDFRKWMAEGKVVILRVPNARGLGEHAVKTLVHWITLKAFMTRFLMKKDEQENGCFIVFNEPEQYESEGLSKLMGRIGTEGRKERLGSIYAFHHWNKLSPALQENLQGGGVQQFLLMNDYKKTFDLSSHRFEDTIPIEDAYKLPAHHAIVSVRAGSELQPAFICRMTPPVEQRYNNSFLTKRHARMYGRSWAELQKVL